MLGKSPYIGVGGGGGRAAAAVVLRRYLPLKYLDTSPVENK
jgi:hypothetical protein